MSNFFSESQQFHSPNRSLFIMDHERLMTTTFGREDISLCEMTLPGDTWKHHSEAFVRLMPMLSPVMTRLDLRTETFYVPFRILWPKFPKFLRQQSQIDNNVGDVYSLPTLEIDYGSQWRDSSGTLRTIANDADARYFINHSILDQIGYQCADNFSMQQSEFIVPLLPILAYTAIWHEYYRDENLQVEYLENLIDYISHNPNIKLNDEFELDNGNTLSMFDALILAPFQRAYEKDYFTSALPWTQKGAPVRIPLNLDATNVNNTVFWKQTAGHADMVKDPTSNTLLGRLRAGQSDNQTIDVMSTNVTGAQVQAGRAMSIDNSENLGVRTTIQGVTGPTVNEFRAALQLQKWKERNALSGTRYTELLLAHWGVKSSDASLQRPLFLGGSKIPVQISTITETAQNPDSQDGPTIGDMYGHGVAAGNSDEFEFTFEEHGLIIQLYTVMPRTSYMQGVRRWLEQTDELDFGWPLLANLGEQPIYNWELYNYTTDRDPRDIFGYQERYVQYKFIPPSVHGSFRDTLLYWHLGRKFDAPPQLNENFIVTKPENMMRIFNYTQMDHDPILIELYNKTRAIRELPYHAKPM